MNENASEKNVEIKNTTPLNILKKYYGYDAFRPLQEEIINTVIAKKDAVVIMPTGGGKSICFQIPAIAMQGVAIVVSPLISLMHDQVMALKGNGINAAYLNSSIKFEEQNKIIEQAKNNQLHLMYVSPEKLMSTEFKNLLQNLQINLFAIDEAHCISQWGHDFRKEYTQMGFIKKEFPKTPLIALTATADKITRRDIINQLKLNQPKKFIASFDRPNLNLEVRPGRKKKEQIVKFVTSRIKESGIVYCLSKKNTEAICQNLKDEGIHADYYHAGRTAEQRRKVQDNFINDKIKVVCATIAFGMGIDKSNVRYVIHHNLPKNIESYYQEIGRAGRDGLPSDTLLFYSLRDFIVLKGFLENAGQKELQESKLKRMQEFAEASICRRKILLAYFGEVITENCNNCDVCKNPPKFIDGTILAQKALAALVRINRLEQTTGLNLLVDVLRGSGKREIFEKGLNEIKTYGIGRDLSWEDWQIYLVQFLQQGLFEIAYDKNNVLQLTKLGEAVLKSKYKVLVVSPQLIEKKKAEEVVVKKTSKTSIFKDGLFEHLRTIRSEIAQKQNVPPYVIFSDKTLKELCEDLPITNKQMLQINGIGEMKLEKYGQLFLQEIWNFTTLHIDNVGFTPKGSTQKITYWLTQIENNSIENAAKIRAIKERTIVSHLIKLNETAYNINLEKYLEPADLTLVLKTYKSKKEEENIYETLQNKIADFKIALALHVLNNKAEIEI